MHYMMTIKGPENGETPPQALFDAVDQLIAEQQKSGILVSAGGLGPTSEGARVRIKGGQLVVTDGPFTEAKEVVGGFSIVNANSREEAIQMAKEFMDMHIKLWPGWEGECEVRPMMSAI